MNTDNVAIAGQESMDGGRRGYGGSKWYGENKTKVKRKLPAFVTLP